jgi:hypothetical protein
MLSAKCEIRPRVEVISIVYKYKVPTENKKKLFLYVISGFRREVHEICALLGCYAASSGNPLPKFRYNISVPSS